MKLLKQTGLVIYSIWAYTWFFLLGLLTAVAFALIILVKRKNAGSALYRCCYYYDVVWSFLCGMRYNISGREYFQPGRSYIITCNHNVTGDLFPIAISLNHIQYRPLGKVELQHVPIIGFLFKQTLIFVDRGNAESRQKSMEVMKEKILREKISILIFPEGTRNRTGKPLKEFYDGAFKLAIASQVPIIPMVMLDTDKATPRKSPLIHPTRMTTLFLPPVDTTDLTEQDVPALKKQVYDQMEQVVLKHLQKTEQA